MECVCEMPDSFKERERERSLISGKVEEWEGAQQKWILMEGVYQGRNLLGEWVRTL